MPTIGTNALCGQIDAVIVYRDGRLAYFEQLRKEVLPSVQIAVFF